MAETPDLGCLTQPFKLHTIADEAEAAFLRQVHPAVPDRWLVEEREALTRFAERLLQFTREHNGVGFAAPQLGIPLQCFAWTPGDDRDSVWFNPEVIRTKGGMRNGVELCFSCPGEVRRVPRWDRLRVTAGWVCAAPPLEAEEPFVTTVSGFDARAWAHEYDHCQGRLITETGTPAKA